jgi:hypothetical protein
MQQQEHALKTQAALAVASILLILEQQEDDSDEEDEKDQDDEDDEKEQDEEDAFDEKAVRKSLSSSFLASTGSAPPISELEDMYHDSSSPNQDGGDAHRSASDYDDDAESLSCDEIVFGGGVAGGSATDAAADLLQATLLAAEESLRAADSDSSAGSADWYADRDEENELIAEAEDGNVDEAAEDDDLSRADASLHLSARGERARDPSSLKKSPSGSIVNNAVCARRLSFFFCE